MRKIIFHIVLLLMTCSGTAPGMTRTFPAQEAVLPDSVIHPASRQYKASRKKQKWMGKNYRDVWSLPVKVPVFDISTEKGGLKILKSGGGQQTQSIRLEDNQGHQFALRSLEKFVEGALPENVHHTFAVDVVQDNISASNPYAAMPVARLAESAGIMHTNPRVVFVPHDARLGKYRKDVSGNLFLMEERPSGDWSQTESFGFSDDIAGTDDVLEAIMESPAHQVDQKAVLKARIFDTFINDWDRHDDQWRWASFKQEGKTVYRPIPRDRDQAFYVNEGILPWIASRKWLMPKIQGFAPATRNMDGLIYNARYFDRTFLNQPSWNDWQTAVHTLQSLLTDEQIELAMQEFPEEVQPLVAEKTASILKQRRDHLEQMALRHYLTLAKQVDVTGTDRADWFEVNRKANGQTLVSIYSRISGTVMQKPWYQRVFQADETTEIRLYGMDGEDHYALSGEVTKGSRIRIIGGKGADTIVNQSVVKKPGKQTLIYDLKKNTAVSPGKDARIKLSGTPAINTYDRKAFRYNVVTPGVWLGYNQDDGIFIGGGPVFNNYRFRRHDSRSVMVNFATKTSAFNVRYQFDSESEIRGFDHHAGVELKAPNYVMNYFGMGNESLKDDAFGDEYYRLNVNQLILNYALGYRWGKTAREKKEEDEEEVKADKKVNQSELLLGAFFKSSDVEEQTGHFISDLARNGLTKDDLSQKIFSGIYAQYSYSKLNNEINPQEGYQVVFSGEQFFHLNDEQNHFFRLNADLRAYLSLLDNSRAVLAIRAGGMRNFGDFYFLEAAKLGGKTNLRGYLSDRFHGHSSFYQNMEMRFKLSDFSSYILNGELGVLGFYDAGKVWAENEESDKWHQGYGGGFWVSPFEMAVFTVTYNGSREDKMLQVTLNFKF